MVETSRSLFRPPQVDTAPGTVELAGGRFWYAMRDETLGGGGAEGREAAGGNPPDDISGGEWDYARIAWGSPWRMPTHEEALELIEKCAWEAYTENGVAGAKVTGPNGNSIFLPFAGYRYGETYYGEGRFGHCWTSTLHEGTPTRHRAYKLVFNVAYDDNKQPYLRPGTDFPFIYGGYSIRPVQD